MNRFRLKLLSRKDAAKAAEKPPSLAEVEANAANLARLVRFYRHWSTRGAAANRERCRAKLAGPLGLQPTLDKRKGDLPKMFAQLVAKYGPEPGADETEPEEPELEEPAAADSGAGVAAPAEVKVSWRTESVLAKAKARKAAPPPKVQLESADGGLAQLAEAVEALRAWRSGGAECASALEKVGPPALFLALRS